MIRRTGSLALAMLLAVPLAACATGVASTTATRVATPPPLVRSTGSATASGHSSATTPATSGPPITSATGGIGRRARAAVQYANRQGMTSGIAVLDTSTNTMYTAGNAAGYYASASVVKTLIATRLLLDGQLSGAVDALATGMIERSDNAAAWTLYPRVGKDALLPWVQRHYRIAIGAPPTMPGIWGSIQISARGLVTFYAAVRHDRKVWPWLARTMHAYRSRSTSGEPNAFGIAAAAPSSAIKNGWDTNRDVRAPSNAIVDSTGFVEHYRYAVAILSEGPGSLYFSRGEQIVTTEARLLMPRGRLS